MKKGAELYLTWHRPRAKKGSLKDEPYGLVALPVLTCLSLARERGIFVSIDDPYVPMYALD